MNDPVSVMIRLITNLFIFIGGLIGEAINTGLMTLLRGWNSGGRENSKKRELARVQENEDARQTECRKAVLDFAHGFGYLTREVMSQKEVGELIDSGISGQALIDTFYKRMGQIPGIFLGQREMTGGGTLDIKLPFSLRSRHCYLIGRSGSGKTNLIRTMIMQDIFFGRGVGVLAPESELLTDELLPYIPEDRIDDIVYVNPDG